MAVASTDYLQEIDAASTHKMAPTTPMQVMQKPQQARESTNVFPSLFLGGVSELKGASIMPHAISHKPMPVRPGLASMSTSSKLHSRIWLDNQKEGSQQDENLVSFCLSKYEKKYQTPDASSPLCNHMGPLPLHKVHAHAGHSHMLLAEACVSPHRHVSHPETQCLRTGLEKLPEESPAHAQDLEKKVFRTPTSVTGATYDTEVNDSATLYSPAPGEVAHDAYELYSKMFPSTCTGAAEHSPPPDADMGPYLPSPFLDHMNNMQPLRPASYDQKPLVRDRCEQNDDPFESGKKIKFAKVKEEDTPGGYLDVKKEPILLDPCCPADVRISSAGPSHGDVKPFRKPPESLSTVLCSPNSGKVVHSVDCSGGCAGHASVEVISTQPVVGLKLFTSACMQMPKTLSSVSATERSTPLSSEPSTRVTNKTPVQGNSSMDADWGRYLALSATPARSAEIAIMLPFQQRFKELQAFLKQCDEGDQNESIQALRTLSAAARSGYAVELETRAIRLSLEEGKEMKRMRLLNVLGRISEANLDTAGATPHGPRLPAPGGAPTPKHVI